MQTDIIAAIPLVCYKLVPDIRGLSKRTQLHDANVVAKSRGAEAKACNMLAWVEQQSLKQWRHDIIS